MFVAFLYSLSILSSMNSIHIFYGSLYVTLCFVLCRFDFDVLTFYFCILCVLMHILNGAIHEVEPRWRRNEEGKARVKVF